MPDQHRIGSKRGNFFARCCTVDWCETNEWSTNWSATPQDVQKKNEKKVENATARSNSWNQNEDFIAKAQQFYKLQSWVKGREARAEKEISTFSQFMLREKMQSEAWNKLLEKWCNFQSQQSHQREREASIPMQLSHSFSIWLSKYNCILTWMREHSLVSGIFIQSSRLRYRDEPKMGNKPERRRCWNR